MSSNSKEILITFVYFVMYAYAINILGKQLENFYGHFKLIIISLASLVDTNLFNNLMSKSSRSFLSG